VDCSVSVLVSVGGNEVFERRRGEAGSEPDKRPVSADDEEEATELALFCPLLCVIQAYRPPSCVIDWASPAEIDACSTRRMFVCREPGPVRPPLSGRLAMGTRV
jgi:hypothetical protein